MEAIPLSETSVAACAKALTFTWISRFGVPETITSDRGPQFTSNLWFQLCELLNISHKQTTAYHPESTVQSRDCTATSKTRFAHALLQQHGPSSYLLCSSDSEHSRGKTLVFPRLKQFSEPKLSCQMNFCKMMNFQLTPLSKNFSETLHVSAPSLPRHNSSTDLPSELPAELLSAPSSGFIGAAWFHHFSHSTTAPTRFCAADPAPSPSESGREMRWSPSAASRLSRPWTRRLAAHVAAADRRVRTQVVLPQPSGSRFQTRWFLHLPLRRRHETVPEPFSYPARRILHAWDRRHLHRCHSTLPINGHRHEGWTSDLFSSQPRPELGGSPVDTCLHPWLAVRQLGVLQQHWTVHVQCLYISCYVTVNKPVLSYLLSHLLPQTQILYPHIMVKTRRRN
jgi:hypothetical protein